ncbi:MAG TPA: hypothetical protein VHG89_07625 [Verrucomicrobiae bacterium]|nr:hypothetical protein [Verrucomicrobiae bacterium]
MNRRNRQRLHIATGALSLAIWLLIGFAETHPSFHAWLHGGSIPDDDDCAVAVVLHGNTETTTFNAPVSVPIGWIEIQPLVEFSVFSPFVENLPLGRAPPAPCSVS